MIYLDIAIDLIKGLLYCQRNSSYRFLFSDTSTHDADSGVWDMVSSQKERSNTSSSRDHSAASSIETGFEQSSEKWILLNYIFTN